MAVLVPPKIPVTTRMTLQFLLAKLNQNLQGVQLPQKFFHPTGGETLTPSWCSNPHHSVFICNRFKTWSSLAAHQNMLITKHSRGHWYETKPQKCTIIRGFPQKNSPIDLLLIWSLRIFFGPIEWRKFPVIVSWREKGTTGDDAQMSHLAGKGDDPTYTT